MSNFTMELPAAVSFVLERLSAVGHESWLVGGCVRDAVMGMKPHDFDVTASAMPEETIAAFEGFRIIETGLKHGTVTVLVEGEPVEITTYRVEGDYLDHRHPSSVSFTRSVEEDLKRRDFTVNAMAYHPEKGLLDLFGGCKDIENRRIACVGSAAERFEEDGLRIMRALRFASRLGFTLEEETDRAAHELSHLLGGISAERLYSELCGILMGEHAGSIILRYSDVLAAFIPELSRIIGFAQNSIYHCYDVMEHTCRAIDGSARNLIVRLALLFHDIGKPVACFTGEDGYDHYRGHEAIGAQMADEILLRLRADTHTRSTVVKLIEMHDRAVTPDRRVARRLLRDLSYEEARLLMEVKLGDRSAHAPEHRDISQIVAMAELIDNLEAEGECVSLSSLAVRGRDLIGIGVRPGEGMGRILNRLLDMVINGEVNNEHDVLLAQAARLAEENTDGE